MGRLHALVEEFDFVFYGSLSFFGRAGYLGLHCIMSLLLKMDNMRGRDKIDEIEKPHQ